MNDRSRRVRLRRWWLRLVGIRTPNGRFYPGVGRRCDAPPRRPMTRWEYRRARWRFGLALANAPLYRLAVAVGLLHSPSLLVWLGDMPPRQGRRRSS